MGYQVLVFSLLKDRDTLRSQSSRDVCKEDVFWSGLLTFQIIKHNVYALVFEPKLFIKAFLLIFDLNTKNIGVLLRALLIFPKSIHIGIEAKKDGAEHIHTHWAGLSIFSAQVASTISGQPLSFTLHTVEDAENPGIVRQLGKAAFARCCSAIIRKTLMDQFPKDKLPVIRVIYISGFELKDVLDQGYILTVCRLVPKKGIIYLIKACSILKQKDINFKLKIIGDGVEKAVLVNEVLKHNLSDQVQFLGALTHEEALEAISKCSFFVAPSVYLPKEKEKADGLPTAIIEAMSVGKPIITTEVGGIPEVIIDKVNGLIIPQQDELALATSIEELLKNSTARNQLGENAYNYYKMELDGFKNVQRLSKMFFID